MSDQLEWIFPERHPQDFQEGSDGNQKAFNGSIDSVLREAIQSHRQSISTLENGAVFHGMSRLVAQPEFTQSNSLRPLLELMDSHPEAVVPMDQTQLGRVWIGAEHPHKA